MLRVVNLYTYKYARTASQRSSKNKKIVRKKGYLIWKKIRVPKKKTRKKLKLF